MCSPTPKQSRPLRRPDRARPLQQQGGAWLHTRGNRHPAHHPNAPPGATVIPECRTGLHTHNVRRGGPSRRARGAPGHPHARRVDARPSERFVDVVGSLLVINFHPTLPGAFDGKHAIERKYAAFQVCGFSEGRGGHGRRDGAPCR